MACNDCNSPIETVPLLPNCTPIPPCNTACEQTLNAKCIIYTGDSLTDIGITIANPEMETVVEKLKTTLINSINNSYTTIIKDTDFQINTSEKIYYLRGLSNATPITRTITLPTVTTLPVGSTWKFVFEWVANTTWVFNTAIGANMGLASNLTNIQAILGTSLTAKSTSALPSFNLTVVNNNGANAYMVYK